MNLPRQKDFLIQTPYISYFLKKHGNKDFIQHSKENIDQILFRTNNNFALNIINNFELHIKRGYGLMLALRKQKSMSFSGKILNDYYKSEIEKYKTLGMLANEILEKINNIDNTIITNDKHYYEYFNNYILLRNCLTHNNGIITQNEVAMEIRLPIMTKDQIEEIIHNNAKGKLIPKTIIRKWKIGEIIQLELSEVEGIAYGLIKVSFIVLKHMYKSADKHFMELKKAGK